MPSNVLFISGLIDLTFASSLPSHSRYDDKNDTDEKDDDAEGRERDYYPFLLLALILLVVSRFCRFLLIIDIIFQKLFVILSILVKCLGVLLNEYCIDYLIILGRFCGLSLS